MGDSLRAIYDQLSRDPNSLANLDQDLPNYAQHQVPIFSLPQEWLWCESWCSDDSKSTVSPPFFFAYAFVFAFAFAIIIAMGATVFESIDVTSFRVCSFLFIISFRPKQ